MKAISASLAITLAVIISTACNRNTGVYDPAKAPTGSLRVYVTNEASGDLSVIDAAGNLVTTIPLGKRPRGVHLSPDGKLLYVALSGSPIAGPGVDESTLPPADKKADGIGVVDVERNTFVKLMPAGSDPEEFALSQDGSKLYIANEDAGLASILDMSSGVITKSLPVGDEPEGVALSPDGSFVYVSSEDDGTITVIKTADDTIMSTFKVGRRPRVAAFLPDGSHAYVSLENDGAIAVVDAKRHALLRTIKFEGQDVKPMGIAVAPDGKRIYVTTGRFGRVFAITTSDDEIVGSVVVGTRPWGIAITPDGRTLYTANGPSNDVSVVDAETLQVTARIKVGDRPWGVAILK